MKKLISLFLLTAILLASCGSETGDETTAQSGSDGTTTEAAQTDRLDELGARDFGKRKFLILDAHDYPQNTTNRPRDDLQGDVLNDAIYARDSRISEHCLRSSRGKLKLFARLLYRIEQMPEVSVLFGILNLRVGD